jgi:hypothetical protein
VPLLDRAEGWLRLARLVPAWANELADATSSPSALEGDLWHYLHEDVINGLLDDSGPLINGSRLGLRFIDSSWSAAVRKDASSIPRDRAAHLSG